MTPFVIVGDEAWTEREFEAHERAKRTNRRWMRLHRGQDPRDVVAGLHALRCSGPTRNTGCLCTKIPLYGEPE